MNKTEDIIKALSKVLPELRSNYYVEQIGIFGSYAKGRQEPHSDIDFAVKFKDDCPDIFDNKYRLKEFLKSYLRMDVDIANLDYLKPYIREHIKDELLYVG